MLSPLKWAGRRSFRGGQESSINWRNQVNKNNRLLLNIYWPFLCSWWIFCVSSCPLVLRGFSGLTACWDHMCCHIWGRLHAPLCTFWHDFWGGVGGWEGWTTLGDSQSLLLILYWTIIHSWWWSGEHIWCQELNHDDSTHGKCPTISPACHAWF